jgi:dTDP-4-amino-4,6-dideoxygalactose transaminase
MNQAGRDQAALHVPRLPVFGWGTLASPDTGEWVPSVIDDRAHILTTSGRAAILLGLQALGVGPGDRVLMPTYHCPTMIAPVIQLGAHPVFYPIGEDGMPRLDQAGGEVVGAKALLAAHWFGLPMRFAGIAAWCRQRGIGFIEDCAHAFYGEVDGAPIGRSGDLCIASLPKFLPVPEGGCLAGRPELLAKVQLAPCGAGIQLRRALDVFELGARYGTLGFLGKALGAAFALKTRLRTQGAATTAAAAEELPVDVAERLDMPTCLRRPASVTGWIVRHADRRSPIGARRANYRRLASLLSGLRGARPLRPELGKGAVPYVFPLLVDDPEVAYQQLRAAAVPVFRWDRIWPGTPQASDDAGVHWARHVLQLGCHQDLAEDDLGTMAELVRRFVDSPANPA